MAFELLIPAFPAQGEIPRLHTCDGADLSPALEWRGEPGGTKSFALLVEDPDAPGKVWTHWILFDIPANVHHLPQAARPGLAGRSGTNDFGNTGYGGPCPPKGHGSHRYFFRLYALGVATLGLEEGASRAHFEKALKPVLLAETSSMGRYHRS